MELGFGGGAITKEEWEWISKKCKELNAKTLLEIGSGFSTICFMDIMEHVDSYETSDVFIEELIKKVDKNKVSIIKYYYPNFPIVDKKYDVALIDGPGQFNNNGRLNSMIFAEPLSNYVFIHDFSRRGEKLSREIVFIPEAWEIVETFSRTMFLKKKPDAPKLSIKIASSKEIVSGGVQLIEETQSVSDSTTR